MLDELRVSQNFSVRFTPVLYVSGCGYGQGQPDLVRINSQVHTCEYSQFAI